MKGNYYIYITTNPAKTVLYTGITNDLKVRMRQHYENRGKRPVSPAGIIATGLYITNDFQM